MVQKHCFHKYEGKNAKKVRMLEAHFFSSHSYTGAGCNSTSISATRLVRTLTLFSSFSQVVGYKGRAVVVVSCVTADQPYRPHPHNLVGKEGCKKGVCTLEIPPDTMTMTFQSLGIQCVKKKEIEEALALRQQIRVDPFQSE